MKKLFAIAALAILMSSCSTQKMMVNTTRVNHQAIESTTMATIKVGEKRISYTYLPAKSDSKSLSESQLIQNAMYMALAENGNADVLVKVNSFVTYKKGLFGKRVQSISITGYPAYYTNFRQPNDEDLKRVYVFKGGDAVKAAEEKGSFMSLIFGK